MLFVAVHTHTAESCPVDNPVAAHQLASPEHAKESGVKVIGSYVAPQEHVFYFVLEANAYASVVKFFRPFMKIGITKVTPVQTLQEAMGIFPLPAGRRGRRKG